MVAELLNACVRTHEPTMQISAREVEPPLARVTPSASTSHCFTPQASEPRAAPMVEKIPRERAMDQGTVLRYFPKSNSMTTWPSLFLRLKKNNSTHSRPRTPYCPIDLTAFQEAGARPEIAKTTKAAMKVI